MPLDEIPSNVHRNQSTKRHGFNPPDMGNDAISHAKTAPLAIQSMLKNTTELGDVGMFATKPPRMPRSSTLTSLDNRSKTSGNTSSYPHGTHVQRVGQGVPRLRSKYMSSPGQLRRSDTVRSSMTAYQYQPRSRRPRPRPGPQSYCHPPHSHGSHITLHSHRSLASLRSKDGLINAFSSYDAYPHRASAQGLPRSISSARSNVYEYRNQARDHVPRQTSFGTISSSPRSMSSIGRGLHSQRLEFNASARSLRPLPSPAISSRWYHPTRRSSFSRTTTPASGLPRHRRFDSATSLHSGPTSPTDSVGPFYYDYSESFHGGETLLLPPQSEHPSILEAGSEDEGSGHPGSLEILDAQTSFGAVPGSAFSPVELPTRHNRRPSEQSLLSKHSRKASSRSARSPLSPPLEMATEDVEGENTDPRYELDEMATQSEPDTSEPVSRHREWTTGRNSMNTPRDWSSPSSSIIFTSASRSPRNLSDLAARAHSPISDSLNRDIRSIDSIAQDNHTSGRVDVGILGQNATRGSFGLPSFRFRPLSIGMSSAGRPSTSPISTPHGAAEIVSPRPERPTSSESRKRFSKILDVDHASTMATHVDGRTLACGLGSRLEPVNEVSSPIKTPTKQEPYTSINVQSIGSRWSGATSLEKSTVDSILDRHIECLGLKAEEKTGSEWSVSSNHGDGDLKQIQEKIEAPDKTPVPQSHNQDRSESSSLQRPTSLSSSAQKKLMPRRLFADSKTPTFPLASSDSEAQFSLAWTDEHTRPSYGWLSLASASKVRLETEQSRQTLLSGDLADGESHADKNFRIRRHSSPYLPPISSTKDSTGCAADGDKDVLPCHRWNSNRVPRQTSQRRRKMKLHLKTSTQNLTTSTSDDWVSLDDNVDCGDPELQQLGMTRVPMSAVDGFAELSGESAGASQRSLTSVVNSTNEKLPDTWSSIVSAMPVPSARPTGLRKARSVNTIRSHRSRRSIVDPINNSRGGSRRQSHEVRAQSSVPRLAKPDLGPSMRASQFDLTSGFRTKAPMPKTSSFSEPKGLLEGSPPSQDRRKGYRRRRFHSLRQIMPGSTQGSASSPPVLDAQRRHYIVSQSCRTQPPALHTEKGRFLKPWLCQTLHIISISCWRNSEIGAADVVSTGGDDRLREVESWCNLLESVGTIE